MAKNPFTFRSSKPGDPRTWSEPEEYEPSFPLRSDFQFLAGPFATAAEARAALALLLTPPEGNA